jgi:hypothetical protein
VWLSAPGFASVPGKFALAKRAKRKKEAARKLWRLHKRLDPTPSSIFSTASATRFTFSKLNNRPTSAAVYASRVFGGVIGGAPMLEDDLPGFLGFVRFRLSHRPSRLGTHPRQSRIQRLPRPSRLLPFNFTPEQTKLFDRMLRYKTPPNAASSANSA